jgi:kinesin family protein 5
MSNRENIKVICRLRPLNQKEKDSGCGICITNTKENVKISIGEEGNFDYTFDRVFGSEASQDDVFEFVAKPIIEGALEGWNGTLFCYGQTSSGKTHTMEGVHGIPELRGIIPRMMEYVFDLILNASTDLEFTVKCSFLEIYNEKIQDLLDPRKNNLMVKEEKGRGIWVDDATEIYVLSKEEMYDVFKIGSENRKVGSTAMNSKSSRSHSLFIVTIFQKNNKTDSTKTGKIYFVDLAGSEKMSKTGIEGGQMLEEAKNINKSLLNLGMVINALTEGRGHVPYRDSKLTRVLQESLGGNSMTTLVINCSMSSFNDKESLSTLRFGQRAKAIKNKVVNNTERSAKELMIKLHEAEEKIKYYQNYISQIQNGDLVNLNTGNNKQVPITQTLNEIKSCEDCTNAMRKLLNQHIELVTIQEELERIKQDKQELDDEIAIRNSELYEANEKSLMAEMKVKIFIEEELKTYGEIQLRLENIFIQNQNKLLELNKFGILLDQMKNEFNNYISKKNDSTFSDFHKYVKKIEESLIILKKVEDSILFDNKNFNDIVDFISGKNTDNNNLAELGNNNNFKTINNINLNINKNININIIKKNGKRRNSFSFSKNVKNNISQKMNISYTFEPFLRNSIDLTKKSDYDFSLNDESLNNSDLINVNELYKDQDSSINNLKQTLVKQRQIMTQLANNYKQANDKLTLLEKQTNDNLYKDTEKNEKIENKIKEYEEIINVLNEKIMVNQEEFDLYKTKSLMDFEYKEKKIVDLVEKVAELEDENYKIIHFSKDKDKKKYLMMEKQIKEFTNELQRVTFYNFLVNDRKYKVKNS